MQKKKVRPPVLRRRSDFPEGFTPRPAKKAVLKTAAQSQDQLSQPSLQTSLLVTLPPQLS
jgi:hypothetical protein